MPAAPEFDLVIVGGGTAGYAAALNARAWGLTALLFDDGLAGLKACGEGLSPGACAELGRLGVRCEGGVPFFGIRYISAGRTAAMELKGPPGLGIMRPKLLAALRSAAIARGVVIVAEKARDFAHAPETVAVNGRTGRYLIAADGLRSPLRRRFGPTATAGSAQRWGSRRHYRLRRPLSRVEVYWSSEAELYLTPVGVDTVNVAVLTTAKVGLPAALAGFSEQLAALGDPLDDWRGAGMFGALPRSRIQGRILYVGDAAGIIDPLTGEGNRLALAGARLAVGAIAAGDPAAYERAWLNESRSYRWLTRGLLAARRLAGPKPIVAAAWRFPRLFSAAVHAL